MPDLPPEGRKEWACCARVPHEHPVDDRARETAAFTAYVVREGTGRG